MGGLYRPGPGQVQAPKATSSGLPGSSLPQHWLKGVQNYEQGSCGQDVGGLEAEGPGRKLVETPCAPGHPAPRRWAPGAACLEDARGCFWCWYLSCVPVRANLECEPEGAGRSIQRRVLTLQRTGPWSRVSCSLALAWARGQR